MNYKISCERFFKRISSETPRKKMSDIQEYLVSFFAIRQLADEIIKKASQLEFCNS